MIRINLTPFEELENRHWWVPDAALFGLVILLTFGGVYLYIGSVEQDIAVREAEKLNMANETANLQTDVSKFNDLNSKIALLDNRKNSLKQITESKLIRYLPVILMENIQNLKPDKVWFTGLAFVDKKRPEADAAPPPPPPADGQPAPTATPVAAKAPAAARENEFPVTIEILGQAIDNVAIADFMLSLKATQNQSFEKSDLRTQLFFSDVGIAFSEIVTDRAERSSPTAPGAAQAPEARPDLVKFKLLLTFKEKLSPAQDGKFSQFIDQFKQTGNAKMN